MLHLKFHQIISTILIDEGSRVKSTCKCDFAWNKLSDYKTTCCCRDSITQTFNGFKSGSFVDSRARLGKSTIKPNFLTNFRYKECCPCIYKLAYLVDYRLRLRKQGVWEISKSKSHKSTRKVDWKYLTKWWKTTTLIWKSIFSSFFVGEVGFGQLSEDPYKFHIATSSSNCPYETSLPGVWFAHWF